jgi:tRNA U34 5-carboxymethylaminomethyl modifying GTPase MnmE/TrmE
MDKENSNLFTVLNRGDVNILKALKKAIVLVGLTRAGKSTVFNWLLRISMIGQGKKATNTKYVVEHENNAAAKVAATFVSVTLTPNVSNDFNDVVSLIDMAGYEDTRDYVGTIGVSYFLKAVFEKVREVKFLMVFDEHRLKEETGKGIIDTFKGFINMFNFAEMDKETKEQLINSIGVVITKAVDNVNHI